MLMCRSKGFFIPIDVRGFHAFEKQFKVLLTGKRRVLNEYAVRLYRKGEFRASVSCPCFQKAVALCIRLYDPRFRSDDHFSYLVSCHSSGSIHWQVFAAASISLSLVIADWEHSALNLAFTSSR